MKTRFDEFAEGINIGLKDLSRKFNKSSNNAAMQYFAWKMVEEFGQRLVDAAKTESGLIQHSLMRNMREER